MKTNARITAGRCFGARALLALILMSGCATVPIDPAEAQYKYHEPPAAAGVATITGSESIMFDILLLPSWKTAYISAVDGWQVAGGKAAWKQPLRIEAGMRTVTVSYQHLGSIAEADFQINAPAGASYVLKFNAPTSLSYQVPDKFVELWIEDSKEGKAVTTTVHRDFYTSYIVSDPDEAEMPDENTNVALDSAKHSRPPVDHGGDRGNDHGDHPPHSGGSGGPPSIPHDPRPSPGGGGGHNSGGGGSSHSSGGGSGGSSGHAGGGSSGGGGGSSHTSGGSGKKG